MSDGQWTDVERATRAFWSSAPRSATASGVLTYETLRHAFDACLNPPEPGPSFIVTDKGTVEAAGRGMGWPSLDAYFDWMAREAAHTIFGNIAFNVTAAVSAFDAGKYALSGEWPATLGHDPRGFTDAD